MSSLTERLLKSGSKGVNSSMLESSVIFNDTNTVSRTKLPILNIALQGDVVGGLPSGLITVAGPSKHFKSNLSLLMVGAYMKKYPDAICVFYDNEFGITKAMFRSMDIDISRLIHVPIRNVEDLKFDMVNKLKDLEREDHVIFLLDSMGNLASKKELEDAENEKSVADMSRAKALKSFYRMITPDLTIKDIPFIQIAHVYDTQEFISKTVISGGCLVEGTKLRMADGTLKPIQDIVCGDAVDTLMGSKEVTHTWTPDTLAEGTPECYEIEFDDGYIVTCSKNHPFLVQRTDGSRVWVKACELTTDDDIIHT